MVERRDFGRDLIGDESFSDITLLMKEGKKLKVCSEVLCYNSRVFVRLLDDLGITSHEVDDFENAAVECFVDCLYSGETATLDKPVFRDVHKMAHVFEVSWLAQDCEDYFKILLCESNEHDSDGLIMFFLFEEAVYIKKSFKKNQLLDRVVARITQFHMTADFISMCIPSTEVFNDLPTIRLDVMIEVANEKVELLASIITKSIQESRFLTKNAKYLLERLDLARCMERDGGIYFELFDVLHNLEDLTSEEMRLLFKLQLESSKKGACSTVDPRIHSLFCTFHKFEKLTFPELLNALGQSHAVKNLYMYIDGICFWLHIINLGDDSICCTQEIIKQIVEIKEERQWRKISKSYLDSWKIENSSVAMFFEDLSESDDLVSTQFSPLVSNTMKASDFFLDPQIISFFRPQDSPASEQSRIQSFTVKTTPSYHICRLSVEFIPKQLSDFRLISPDGEKIYPKDIMHFSLDVTGRWSKASYNKWTPVPPLTWAGLEPDWNTPHCGTRARGHFKWFLLDSDGHRIVDATIHSNHILNFKLYY